ncbi:unnamed protein product [Orchesella dallaii]|uniref:Uncharacterized protein n=1 Tax=Orchesella dallaii TaxID=48710 RepID=A0ABP1Q7F2_9HEXA
MEDEIVYDVGDDEFLFEFSTNNENKIKAKITDEENKRVEEIELLLEEERVEEVLVDSKELGLDKVKEREISEIGVAEELVNLPFADKYCNFCHMLGAFHTAKFCPFKDRRPLSAEDRELIAQNKEKRRLIDPEFFLRRTKQQRTSQRRSRAEKGAAKKEKDVGDQRRAPICGSVRKCGDDEMLFEFSTNNENKIKAKITDDENNKVEQIKLLEEERVDSKELGLDKVNGTTRKTEVMGIEEEEEREMSEIGVAEELVNLPIADKYCNFCHLLGAGHTVKFCPFRDRRPLSTEDRELIAQNKEKRKLIDPEFFLRRKKQQRKSQRRSRAEKRAAKREKEVGDQRAPICGSVKKCGEATYVGHPKQVAKSRIPW